MVGMDLRFGYGNWKEIRGLTIRIGNSGLVLRIWIGDSELALGIQDWHLGWGLGNDLGSEMGIEIGVWDQELGLDIMIGY